MPSLFCCFGKLCDRKFFLVCNTFDVICAISLMVYEQAFEKRHRDIQLFGLMLSFFWVMCSLVSFLVFMIRQDFSTRYHKNYFRVKMTWLILLIFLHSIATTVYLFRTRHSPPDLDEVLIYVVYFLPLAVQMGWSKGVLGMINKERKKKSMNELKEKLELKAAPPKSEPTVTSYPVLP